MKRLLWLLPLLAACSSSPTAPVQLNDLHHCVWEIEPISGLVYCGGYGH